MISATDSRTHLVTRRPFVRDGSIAGRSYQLHAYKTGEAMRKHTESAHGGMETAQPCCVALRRRIELAQKGEFKPRKNPRGILRH